MALSLAYSILLLLSVFDLLKLVLYQLTEVMTRTSLLYLLLLSLLQRVELLVLFEV